MRAVIGLGNIGKPYQGTRHNLGWLVAERLATRLNAPSWQEDRALHALSTRTRAGSESLLLALPTTFMNLSGQAVQALLSFYKLPLENALIIQDELDLPFGSMRFSLGGSAAGHNGIRSIEGAFPNQAIPRLRLGIGRPLTPQPVEDYVLERFSSEEQTTLESFINQAAEAAETWIQNGLDAAQQTWNGKKG